MSHKARKLLTQDTFRKLEEFVDLIPSKSVLVVVGPETVESWELMNDPYRNRMWDSDTDPRRNIGGEAIRQIDYAKWGWIDAWQFHDPRVVVVPNTRYAIQAIERLEWGGLLISLLHLRAFRHSGSWDGRLMCDIWGETRMSIFAEHLRGGVNERSTWDYYLGEAIPAVLEALKETNAIVQLERFESGKPLTFILPPVYAQVLAWAVAETHCRTRKDFFGCANDIVNQPFYGCDAILVTPRGMSILRSGWEPSKFDRERRNRMLARH